METILNKESRAAIELMVADGIIAKDAAERYFPELKESEDERTWIINYLSNRILNSTIIAEKENLKKAVAWLEKQGEHAKFCDSIQVGDKVTRNQDGVLVNLSQLERVAKPTDKIVPKFKIGDWVVIDGEVLHIKEVTEDGYLTDEGGHIPFRCEKEATLWTIQNAKTGNVLACKSGWTCIFKTLVNDETFSSYCFMDNTKWFCETGSECHTLKDEFIKAYNGKIYPATKEQRNLLFQKMKEAGYEWDAEKKELKKKSTEEYNITGIGSKYAQGKLGEMIAKDENDMGNLWYAEDWLKSLRPQTTWKPSDEQMTALRRIKAAIAGEGDIYKPLNSLYQDLLKLMEK